MALDRTLQTKAGGDGVAEDLRTSFLSRKICGSTPELGGPRIAKLCGLVPVGMAVSPNFHLHMTKTTSILSIWSSSSHILAFRIDSASCCVTRRSAGSHGSPKVACEQYTALAHFCGHFFKGNVEQSGSGNFYVSNNQALFPTGGRWLEVPCESRVVSPLQISLEPSKRDCMKMPPPAGG